MLGISSLIEYISLDITITPRRSARLMKKRDKTPEPGSKSAYKPQGPRAIANLNKSKHNKSVPNIISSPEKVVEDPVEVK